MLSKTGPDEIKLYVHVFHMKDGKITEFWAYAEDQNLVDEFWS